MATATKANAATTTTTDNASVEKPKNGTKGGMKGEPTTAKATAPKITGTNEPKTPQPKKPTEPKRAEKKTEPKKTPATKTPKTTTKTPESYADIMKIVALPVDERDTLAIGRNGEKIAPRRFHLTPEKIEALQTEWKEAKQVPNPQNAGVYHSFIEALKALGINKPHTFQAVKAQMRKAMSAADTKDDNGSTAWDRFNGKEAATDNEENALNTDGRIHQNAEVLQRLGGFTPYGLKLLQVGTLVMKTKGCVIDVLKDAKGGKSYRLNTNSGEPLNEFRKRRNG